MNARRRNFESRLGAGVSIVLVLVLMAITPERYRFLPAWFPLVVAAILAAILFVGALLGDDLKWRRLERELILSVVAITVVLNCVNLAIVVRELLLTPSRVNAVQLLGTSVAIWIINLMSFSLIYWVLDRGGPGARARAEKVPPDFAFIQATDENLATPGWQPVYVDYVFLGFTGALSPTDASPLTPRAKLTMMAETLISLVTIAVVVARAITMVQ
jgi:hypothetical protein